MPIGGWLTKAGVVVLLFGGFLVSVDRALAGDLETAAGTLVATLGLSGSQLGIRRAEETTRREMRRRLDRIQLETYPPRNVVR